jgi:MobA/MobL family
MGQGAATGFHLTAKAVSFGKGQSAVHTAAYNARDQLYREADGQTTKDYGRYGAALFAGIFAPTGAPDWARDRQELWNRAEAAERQKNGQPARNMFVAFPHELNQQQREWLIKDFVREQFVRKGMIADVAIHAPDERGDERNYHAHILLTMRKLDGEEFAKTKCRAWNSKEQLNEWREQWASMGARALARAGYAVEAERWRHGHKTLEHQHAAALARGDRQFAERIEGREATIHKGPKITAMERRGEPSERMERLKEIVERNEIRVEIRAIDREVSQLRQMERTQERPRAPSTEERPPARTPERAAPEAYKGEVRARFGRPDWNQSPNGGQGREIQRARQEREAERAQETPRANLLRAPAREAREAPKGREQRSAGLARGAERAGGSMLRGFGKALNGLAGLFEGLLGGAPRDKEGELLKPEPEPQREPPREDGEARFERDLQEAIRAAQRDALLRKFDREVTPETERDAEIERANRERDRGRGGRER